MIIWRGLGFLVFVLTFAALLITELGVESLFGNDNYYQAHGWPKLLGLGLAAGFAWLLSNYLQTRPARIVVDKQTGKEIALNSGHDLFFVPLRYWPAILVVAGVAFMIFG